MQPTDEYTREIAKFRRAFTVCHPMKSLDLFSGSSQTLRHTIWGPKGKPLSCKGNPVGITFVKACRIVSRVQNNIDKLGMLDSKELGETTQNILARAQESLEDAELDC